MNTVTTLSTSSNDSPPAGVNVHSDLNAAPYLDTRVISEHGRPVVSPSERVQMRLKTKSALVDLCREIGENDRADRIEECHSEFAFLTCGNHVLRSVPNSTCEFRLCPFCAARRSRKLRSKYLPMTEAYAKTRFLTPVMVTLTLKHREETLKQANGRLVAAFKKLIRRKIWKKYFRGGLRVFDNTIAKDGMYHAHLHVLAFRVRMMPKEALEQLKADWKDITGDSFVINIRKCSDLSFGLREVLKYTTKPLDIRKGKFGPKHLKDFIAMKKVHLVATFGEFYNFCKGFNEEEFQVVLSPPDGVNESDLIEGDDCPHCGNTLFHLTGKAAAEYVRFRRRVEFNEAAWLVDSRANAPPH